MPPDTACPPPLAEAVSPESLAAIQALPGPHDRSLAVWLESWRASVVRFADELDLPVKAWDDNTRHRYDWLGALHCRSVVAASTEPHSGHLPADVLTWLEAVDAYMRSFTVERRDWNDEEGNAYEDSWWWHRLPLRGPTTHGWWAKPGDRG